MGSINASIQRAVIPPAAITGLLPLFPDSAHLVAMIKHTMTIFQAAVQHLNPSQVPVLAADQPLYALAEQVQWSSPATLGKSYCSCTSDLSVRANFHLYIKSLTKVMPRMFALNFTHYSRWPPLHICDVLALSSKHADVFKEFSAGKFVVQTTSNRFFLMAIEQCHEQRNADAKGTGGAIRLMNDPAALRRWMVAGPEG